MPSSTAKYVIPYPVGTDQVVLGDDAIKNLADRMDLLLGESGTISLTGTSGTQAVSLARTYPGNSGAAVPGIVVLMYQVTISSGTTHNEWVGTFTGTASTITGFTIGWNFSASQSGRILAWRFIPVL